MAQATDPTMKDGTAAPTEVERLEPEVGPAPAYSSDMDFWEWLTGAGYIEGDPAYYQDYEGDIADDPGAYSNAIQTAIRNTEPGSERRRTLVNRLYDEGIITSARTQDSVDYWTNTSAEGLGADMESLGNAAESFFGGAGVDGGPTAPTGIMDGGKLVKIEREGQDPIWGIRYEVSGASHVYTFASDKAMRQALGPNADTGEWVSMNESEFSDTTKNVFNLGSAEPLTGQEGSYQGWFGDILRDASLEAGIRDPGMLGRYMSDPEVQRVMAEASIQGWSEVRQKAELRRTGFYQDILYPGINSILKAGDPNPEGTWWTYHNAVEDNLAMLGYTRDDDGSYRSSIGAMLEIGISDTVFNQMAPIYQRAATDGVFASTLDYWLDKTAGRNVTFDDRFDALAGQTEGDLQLAVESAIIQFQADQYGTSLSDETISRIASQTQLQEQQIAQAFSSSEEALLGLGNQGLKRYGLSEEQLVNAAFGLDTEGVNAVEVRRLANKTMQELGLADDKKAHFYSSFNQRSAMIKPGLAAGAPEMG